MAHKKTKTVQAKKPKSDLGHKLFAIRKQMTKELRDKWFDWAKLNKEGGMTIETFTSISRGDYIAKDNVKFAIKLWQEGKKMLDEFNSSIEKEISELEGEQKQGHEGCDGVAGRP